MLGVRVTVPIACFRKGLAREYLETEPLPPPSTCYGFLLSLVGETDRVRHVGCRVTPALLTGETVAQISVVLRTVWRVKKTPLGSSGNTRPDYQQMLSPVDVLIWLDSSEESPGTENLETRVTTALKTPEKVTRFGGLSLGESTHLANDIWLIDDASKNRFAEFRVVAFLLRSEGRMTLPVWVDHVGSAGTNYVTGDLIPSDLTQPNINEMPKIEPKTSK